MKEGRFVSVATYPSEVEAELAQASLAAAGIESFLKFEDSAGVLPVLQWTEGVRILVEEKNELEARAVLEDESQEEE